MGFLTSYTSRIRPLKPKEIIMVSVGIVGAVLFLAGACLDNSVVLVLGAGLIAASFVVTAYYWLHRHDKDEL